MNKVGFFGEEFTKRQRDNISVQNGGGTYVKLKK